MPIRLHPRLGVNARLTHCNICGEGADIVLLGASNHVDTCAECGIQVYGGIREMSPCPKCKCTRASSRRELEEHEHINAPAVCSKCEEKMKTKIALILMDGEPPAGKGVRLGPVYFMDQDQFQQIFSGEIVAQAMRKRAAYMPLAIWQQIGLPSVEECMKIANEPT